MCVLIKLWELRIMRTRRVLYENEYFFSSIFPKLEFQSLTDKTTRRKNDGGRKEGQMSLNVFSSYTIPIENLEIDETIVRRATLHLNINGVPIPFTTKQETANGWDIFTKLNNFHPPSLCPFAPCVFHSDGINILSIIGIILMREGNCRGVLLMFNLSIVLQFL